MASQNLAGADALLKTVYRGPMVEQLNQEVAMLDILRKTNANDVGTFTGRQIIVPVHSGRNRGRGGMVDGGGLATAGTQGSLDAIITIKYFNGGVSLSDQVIKQTKTNEGAFLSALTLETEGCLTDMKKDINRVVFGTGDGLLASCTATQGPAATFSVDTGQFIAIGDPVDVVVRSTGATGTGAVNRTVTAVAYTGTPNGATQANANITISGANISVDNTYGFYISGDRSNESDGLQNICSTARTLHAINSSSAGNTFWDSNIKDFAQANPSDDGIMQLAQVSRQRGNGKVPDFGILTLGGQRRLANTHVTERRINDKDAITIDGGYETIAVSAGGKAIPVMADVDCPCGKGFLINRSQFGWSQIADPDWLKPPDEGGSIFQLESAGTGLWSRTWRAWLVWDAVLTCLSPNQSGKMINIFDDVPVVRN